jgi:hypothetical protein
VTGTAAVITDCLERARYLRSHRHGRCFCRKHVGVNIQRPEQKTVSTIVTAQDKGSRLAFFQRDVVRSDPEFAHTDVYHFRVQAFITMCDWDRGKLDDIWASGREAAQNLRKDLVVAWAPNQPGVHGERRDQCECNQRWLVRVRPHYLSGWPVSPHAD